MKALDATANARPLALSETSIVLAAPAGEETGGSIPLVYDAGGAVVVWCGSGQRAGESAGVRGWDRAVSIRRRTDRGSLLLLCLRWSPGNPFFWAGFISILFLNITEK
jgi:hypothetical protein